MTPENDIRWHQRFSNYKRALKLLSDAVELSKKRGLSDLEMQGLIQSFEFTYELAWNTMKDYFSYQGNTDISGSRDAIRESFKQGLIEDGDNWMNMISSRIRTTHTYDEKTAKKIADTIENIYFELFKNFEEKMNSLEKEI